MCLSIPGLVEEIFDQNDLTMGKINFGGVRRAACLEYVPGVKTGDYVLVHVGFAIGILDQIEAQRSLELLKILDEESSFMRELNEADDIMPRKVEN
jgi:hydrogenase expression/formation protein HypC